MFWKIDFGNIGFKGHFKNIAQKVAARIPVSKLFPNQYW